MNVLKTFSAAIPRFFVSVTSKRTLTDTVFTLNNGSFHIEVSDLQH